MRFEDRVRIEAWYLRNWSIWLDCIILAKTFKTVLMPRNREDAANITEMDAIGTDSSMPPPQRSLGKITTNSSITAANVEDH